ncbi:MAG TPA: ABC transporter permease [Gemmatimonadaceae bacterium]|nr:ABC transporter permease [Gemmatimonadaceae bacterium]
MRELFTRFFDLFRHDKLETELNDELEFHKTMLERDARAAGSDDAVHAARRQLGNVTSVRERARDAWSFAWLEVLRQDLRYAFRGLRRSPGFTIAAVLTLGLGIGANAAMFGVIDRLMVRTLPYLRHPESVRRVYLQSTFVKLRTSTQMPYTRYLDFKKWTSSFSEFAAFNRVDMVIGVGDEAREEPIMAVSSSYFGFFDATPAVGRFFGPAEDEVPAGAPVVVLSHAYWQSHFGGRNVIGQQLVVLRLSCTIIGVAPPGFTGAGEGAPPALYIPITTYGAFSSQARDYWTRYNWDWTQVLVRLKPGVSATTANADLTNAFIQSRVAARVLHPDFAQVEKYNPHAIAGSMNAAAGPDPGLESRTLVWVAGVALIVLLIACANVANLLLARALRRRREIALRLALGVSRMRLASQALTESLLLALIGCALGVAVAQWGGSVLAKLFVPEAPDFSVVTDWRTLAVAVGAALAAGILMSFAPLLLAGNEDVAKTLKSGVRDGTYMRSRLRSTLLVTQGALSVVLLVGAGLFVRSLNRVHDMHLGYDVRPVIEVNWNRRGVQYSDSEKAVTRQRLLDAALTIPGVEHAAWVSNVVLDGSSTQTLRVRGIDSVSKLGRFDSQTATADYFATMQTRILRGRGIAATDRAGNQRVVVVSEGMAHRIWPAKEPLGECISIVLPTTVNDTTPCATVVGIAEDAVHNPIADEPFRYYMPVDQFPEFGATNLLVRVRGDPARESEHVRRELQKLVPGLSFLTAIPLIDLVDGQRRSWQLGAAMFVGFGLLALIVAAIGLYGVIAYNVAQRMHELGVRVALGAQPENILSLIVSQGVRFALAGVALGTALSLVAARWLQPLLFRQSARDPLVYGTVGATLLVVAVIASAVPALRAAKADPNAALRSD